MIHLNHTSRFQQTCMSCGTFSLRSVTSGDRDPIILASWGLDLPVADISSDVDDGGGAALDDEDDDEVDEDTDD